MYNTVVVVNDGLKLHFTFYETFDKNRPQNVHAKLTILFWFYFDFLQLQLCPQKTDVTFFEKANKFDFMHNMAMGHPTHSSVSLAQLGAKCPRQKSTNHEPHTFFGFFFPNAV